MTEPRSRLLEVATLLDDWRQHQGDAQPILEEVRQLVSLQTTGGTPVKYGKSSETPEWIGPWHIEELLGEGGMGQVFRVKSSGEVERTGALKLVRFASSEVLRRFERERHILARLDHPYIAHYLDSGTLDGGRPWLVMEYVEGVPLDAWCAEHKPKLRQLLDLFRQICDAVAHAHQKMIIHRDLKPANILVDQDGRPRLLDFGIATLLNPTTGAQELVTQMADAVMTPEYASPEQVRCEVLSAASDVYSLGVILYEMLTGSRPYQIEDRTPMGLIESICKAPITRPSRTREASGKERTMPSSRALRGDLDNILLKALEREAARRYHSVEEFSGDLGRYLSGMPVKARPATFSYRALKFARRHSWPLACLASFLLFLCFFSYSVFVQGKREAVLRVKAEGEHEVASRVVDFMVTLFDHADPEKIRGSEVTAKELLDRGRDQIDHMLSEDSLARGRLLLALGRSYISLGLYDDADPLLMEGWNYHEKMGTQAILDYRATLAELRFHQSRFDDALARYDKLLAEISPQREDEFVVRLLLQYSSLLSRASRLEDSESQSRKALDMVQRNFGEKHLLMAEALRGLGSILVVRGDLKTAEPLYRRSLDIFKSHYGDDHPLVALAYNNLANLLSEQGIFETAESIYRQSLAIFEKIYGDENPYTLTCLNNLANVLREQGKYDESETILRRTLAARIALHGEMSPKVAHAYHNLAALLKEKDDFTGAEPLFRKALYIRRNLLGDKHYLVAIGLDSVAAVLNEQGRHTEAEQLYRESLGIRRELFGEVHVHVGLSFYNLASHNRRTGHPEEGVRLALKAEEIFRQKLPADHWFIALARAQRGSCLGGMGRDNEALSLMKEAFEELLEKKGSRSQPTRDAARRLAEFYEARKMAKEAAHWRDWLASTERQ